MAEIFLARPSDAALSKLVAIKRILPKFMNDPAFHEMFKREGAIAMRFRHPAIIAVHELGTINGQLYLSMEYFPGKTLAEIMRTLRSNKTSLEVRDKAQIIKNLAEALQYIHEFTAHGEPTETLHRDICPLNILAGYDGTIKLIDFGIAKISDHETTHSTALKGKVAYMSPEQVRGDILTKQTDIFSLGIVFWELLTGRKLFTGKSVSELATKVLDGKIPLVVDIVPDMPEQLSRICQRALNPQPQLRYPSAGALAADIHEFLKTNAVDGHQSRLAKALRENFPGDVARLQALLKKYEVSEVVEAPPRPPPVVVSGRSGELKSKTKSLIKPRRQGAPAAMTGFIIIFVAALLLLANSFFSTRKTSAPQLTSAPPVVELKPLRYIPPVPDIPAPLVAQIEAVHEISPPPVHSEPAEPKPLKISAVPTPTLVPVPVLVPAKREKPVQMKIVKNKPKAKVRHQKRAVTIERKVAATPASQPFAYVTVLAEPGTKIFINGKLVGMEVVNEFKVSVKAGVVIKTVPEGAAPRSKEFTFKSYSHNVIDMSVANP